MSKGTHVDVYDHPEMMWPLLSGATCVKASEEEIIILTKDGRVFEIRPDAQGRFMLRINEAVPVK